MSKYAVIIGAGPAGLTAAYQLLKTTDIIPIVIEELDIPGGISRTVFHNGNGIDLGGHRLYSKNQDIVDFWEKMLPLQGKPSIDDKILGREITVSKTGPDPDETDVVMLKRRRLSRIYYLKKFFNYPISISPSTIMNMGILRTMIAGFSYIKSCFVKRKEKSLEDFMINRFGEVLYRTFFEKYTQKVWGLHPTQISKEWGEQRIKGLSLYKAVVNAILSPLHLILNKQKETTLIDEFYYPKFGCGQLWQIMSQKITEMGGVIKYNTTAVGFKNDKTRISELIVKNREGKVENIKADYVISSMPVKDLISGLENVPENVRNIAKELPYRDYILAGFYLDKFNLKNNTKIKTINNICPDCWIYIQEEDITAGRMQIMNNWSPYLVKDFKNKVFMSLEYFATEGDEFWNKSEAELLDIAIKDIKALNIASEENILDKVIVKVKKAYPAYFGRYSEFDTVKDYIKTIDNLYCIGRNGQHKYNNMDHSMLSGIEAVNCIKNGTDKDILWKVNTEKEYLN